MNSKNMITVVTGNPTKEKITITYNTTDYNNSDCYSYIYDYSHIINNDGYYNFSYNSKAMLTTKNISGTKIPSIIEEKIEEYIYDHFDKQYIAECGSYIYEIIQEQAYDISSTVIGELEEEYIIPEDIETLIEIVLKDIDFDSLYEIVDNILDAPTTMEEKLAEVGMSYRDFL